MPFEYLNRVKPGSDELIPGEASIRSPSDVTDTEYFNPDQVTASAVYSLFDSVDSESIG